MFYVMYNLSNYDIKEISGQPFTNILENCDSAEISDEDGIEFIEGNKNLHDYYVIVKNGIGEFFTKKTESLRKQFKQNDYDNTIKDLDYKVVFFDIIKIRYVVDEGNLILSTSDLSEKSLKFLETCMLTNKLLATIYVTKYTNPFILLEKHSFLIKDFVDKRTIKMQLKSNEKISVWGSRKVIL